MSITVDQTLLDAAQRLAPVIRAYSQEAEHRGRFSKPALDALTDARLLKARPGYIKLSASLFACGWANRPLSVGLNPRHDGRRPCNSLYLL
jgi:hypothetical protein